MRPADAIVLAAALGLELFFIHRFWVGNSAGETALIQSPGGSQEVRLDRNQTLEIQGRLGPSTLRIEDGAIGFVNSPCQRKICIRSGFHRHTGATTACVPNRISLTVRGQREDGFDAIHH